MNPPHARRGLSAGPLTLWNYPPPRLHHTVPPDGYNSALTSSPGGSLSLGGWNGANWAFVRATTEQATQLSAARNVRRACCQELIATQRSRSAMSNPGRRRLVRDNSYSAEPLSTKISSLPWRQNQTSGTANLR